MTNNVSFGEITYASVIRRMFESGYGRNPVKFVLSSEPDESEPDYKRLLNLIYALGIEDGKCVSELREDGVTAEPKFSRTKYDLLISNIVEILKDESCKTD